MDHPQAFGPALGRCAHLSRERMDARLSGWDITPAQTHVLLYLHHHEGRAPQCEVTRFLKVKPSTANGILDRLEERGLVKRTVSGSDARRRLITLTEKGEARQELFHQVYLDVENTILRGFSPEETQLFRSFLERIIQNLEEDRKL
ncbi:MAG: MarR family transcriptional regulator [Oscillospiraceae bacterium]|nr:MarR family transcriptional regulator [Oscillospiraceae bacterium]